MRHLKNIAGDINNKYREHVRRLARKYMKGPSRYEISDFSPPRHGVFKYATAKSPVLFFSKSAVL